MSAPEDLHAQLAQRLFGWTWVPKRGWHNAEGQWCRAVPPYTTNPAATALVWQWLEAQQRYFRLEYLAWEDARGYRCAVLDGTPLSFRSFEGSGATWPEALCRAALALAEALEKEKS